MKRTRVLVSSVAVTAVLLTGAADPGRADPRDDKKRIDAEVARTASLLEGATERARVAAQRYAAANAALPAAREAVAEARGRVAAAKVRVTSTRRAADQAREAARAAVERYERSAQRVVEAQEQAGSFVSAQYKGSALASMNMLLAARDLTDAADRYGYFDRVMELQRESIRRLSATRRTAKDDQNTAETARRAAEQAERAAGDALAGARAAERAAASAAAEATRLATERKNALAVANSERAAVLARYRAAKAEESRIKAQLRAWEARNNSGGAGAPTIRPGARLLMPVQGWKSSDFGHRFDPYYKVWQLHAGVDIAAPGGTPIRAAAAGRVIRAGWNGGYGNYTCLSHGRYQGKSLTTCYAHQSRILVSAGQQVRAGQVIGRVGTTGASTGYHLHFEVRRDGTPVQPLTWLPACLC
ncbi:M23 family metallopeptidase [Rhizomonospora bruguierae]|uniref:M23 family metallopeptidase n=1 Tax=Rhizomonospora bruguierae TaxID=1581705 RepID=UPI0020C0B4DF|nr:M23 family metallopeptidase [Micromonospora sp. NBRC 107566]